MEYTSHPWKINSWTSCAGDDYWGCVTSREDLQLVIACFEAATETKYIRTDKTLPNQRKIHFADSDYIKQPVVPSNGSPFMLKRSDRYQCQYECQKQQPAKQGQEVIQEPEFLPRDEDPKLIDKGLKHKWHWEWLDKSESLREFINKIRTPGTAYCMLCKMPLRYAQSGKGDLHKHLTTKGHQKALERKQSGLDPKKKQPKKLKVQRKKGCPAKIMVKEVVRYPDYKISQISDVQMRNATKQLSDDLQKGRDLLGVRTIYVRLPRPEDHQHGELPAVADRHVEVSPHSPPGAETDTDPTFCSRQDASDRKGWEVASFPSYQEYQQYLADYQEKTKSTFVKVVQKKHWGKDGKDDWKLAFKEEPKIYWCRERTDVGLQIPFDGVPFIIMSKVRMACMHGPGKNRSEYEKKNGQHIPKVERDADEQQEKGQEEVQDEKKADVDQDIAEQDEDNENLNVDTRLGEVQTEEEPQQVDWRKQKRRGAHTKHMGCPATIWGVQVVRFPEFQIARNSQFRRRDNSKKLRLTLQEDIDSVATEMRFYITVPPVSLHSEHPMTSPNMVVDPKILDKIIELVKEGYTAHRSLRAALLPFCEAEFCQGHKNPKAMASRLCPSIKVLAKIVEQVKKDMLISREDQEKVEEVIRTWSESHANDCFFFRYHTPVHMKGKRGIHTEGNLLLCYQSDWQRHLLARYGNYMSLLTQHETDQRVYPVYFLYVRTNSAYAPVGVMVLHNNTKDALVESLELMRSWNSDWNPQHLLADVRLEDIQALEQVFQGSQVCFSEYARDASWEKWTGQIENGVRDSQQDILDILHQVAAAENMEEHVTALEMLKGLQVEGVTIGADGDNKGHQGISSWLFKEWLPQIKRWANVYRDPDFQLYVHMNSGEEAQQQAFSTNPLTGLGEMKLHLLLSHILDNFLPAHFQRYVQANLDGYVYHQYLPDVPKFLQRRPKEIVDHLMARMSNVPDVKKIRMVPNKDSYIVDDDVADQPNYHIQLGNDEHFPSCTCDDWAKYNLPCKHILCVLHHVPGKGWRSLSSKYISIPLLDLDSIAHADLHVNSFDDEIEDASQLISHFSHQVDVDTVSHVISTNISSHAVEEITTYGGEHEEEMKTESYTENLMPTVLPEDLHTEIMPVEPTDVETTVIPLADAVQCNLIQTDIHSGMISHTETVVESQESQVDTNIAHLEQKIEQSKNDEPHLKYEHSDLDRNYLLSKCEETVGKIGGLIKRIVDPMLLKHVDFLVEKLYNGIEAKLSNVANETSIQKKRKFTEEDFNESGPSKKQRVLQKSGDTLRSFTCVNKGNQTSEKLGVDAAVQTVDSYPAVEQFDDCPAIYEPDDQSIVDHSLSTKPWRQPRIPEILLAPKQNAAAQQKKAMLARISEQSMALQQELYAISMEKGPHVPVKLAEISGRLAQLQEQMKMVNELDVSPLKADPLLSASTVKRAKTRSPTKSHGNSLLSRPKDKTVLFTIRKPCSGDGPPVVTHSLISVEDSLCYAGKEVSDADSVCSAPDSESTVSVQSEEPETSGLSTPSGFGSPLHDVPPAPEQEQFSLSLGEKLKEIKLWVKNPKEDLADQDPRLAGSSYSKDDDLLKPSELLRQTGLETTVVPCELLKQDVAADVPGAKLSEATTSVVCKTVDLRESCTPGQPSNSQELQISSEVVKIKLVAGSEVTVKQTAEPSTGEEMIEKLLGQSS